MCIYCILHLYAILVITDTCYDIYTYIYIYRERERYISLSLYLSLSLYIYIYIYIHTRIHMYIYIYIYMMEIGRTSGLYQITEQEKLDAWALYTIYKMNHRIAYHRKLCCYAIVYIHPPQSNFESATPDSSRIQIAPPPVIIIIIIIIISITVLLFLLILFSYNVVTNRLRPR